MSTGGYYCCTAENAWNTIHSEIDAGRPMITLNTRVTDGHYFVIVGYRYQTNNGDRKIIVYDPFGKWLGSQNLYDRNFSTPDSHKVIGKRMILMIHGGIVVVSQEAAI